MPERSGVAVLITKRCSKCGNQKELTEFSKHKRCKFGVNAACKVCKNKEASDLYKRNGQRESSKYNYFKRLKLQYDLTQEQYDILVEVQQRRCAICGQEASLVVDHDHKTNRVRGLLCTRCNTGLGKFFDSIEMLEKAKQYLE